MKCKELEKQGGIKYERRGQRNVEMINGHEVGSIAVGCTTDESGHLSFVTSLRVRVEAGNTR